MANYTGVKCPVCNKRFTEDDDIVVCPVCGAPHHRTCYQQLGHCALNDLHIKGHAWEPPHEQQTPGQAPGGSAGGTACPACGAGNPSTGLFCQVCGAPLHRGTQGQPQPQQGQPFSPFGGPPYAAAPPAQNPYRAAFGGLNPSEEIDGVSARDLALYVGENSGYFLPRFKQISQGKPVSFNFCALFFNFFYFFYRKMYSVGLILLGITLLAQIPTLFVMPEAVHFALDHMNDIYAGASMFEFISEFQPTQHLWAYAAMEYMRYFLLAVGVVFSLFANRFYLRHAVKKVTRVREGMLAAQGTLDDRRYTETIARAGRTNRAIVVIAAVGCVVAYFAVYILMVMAIMVS